MNLDDLSAIKNLDAQDMLSEIEALPDQLVQAWELGQTLPLPAETKFSCVVISGMGGSAIGAELLAGYIVDQCPLPVIIHRDYGLPAFANGRNTLFIALSHSGDTEETLDAFDQASRRGCTLMVISTGGKLAQKAEHAGCVAWRFPHHGQPRAAVGYSFGLLLAVFSRLGLIPGQSEFIRDAVEAMKNQQGQLGASIPAAQNPAKRYAGQLVGRWVTVFGSGVLSAVARRWKGQINEHAKAPANFEILPEADHNTLAGSINPSEQLLVPHTLTMFLSSASDHPRNRLRANLTRQAFMLEGMNTDFYMAQGNSRLAHMWTAIHFGDYLAFYLAIAYSVDPTAVDALVSLKSSLAMQR